MKTEENLFPFANGLAQTYLALCGAPSMSEK
jgi:hypothetical protein